LFAEHPFFSLRLDRKSDDNHANARHASPLVKRRTVRKEPFAARYGIMFLEVVGFTLLFDDDAGIGFLGQRVLHRGLAVAEIGIAMTWIGILLALSAQS
jgi:hypothetical protein